MRLGFYFLSILLLGLFFELVHPIEKAYLPGPRNFFLLASNTMHLRSFVYYLGEHLTYILLGLIIFFEVPFAKLYAGTFIILEIIDAFDFWVTANGNWCIIQGWPITFNVIKFLVFVLVITFHMTWKLLKRLKSQE